MGKFLAVTLPAVHLSGIERKPWSKNPIQKNNNGFAQVFIMLFTVPIYCSFTIAYILEHLVLMHSVKRIDDDCLSVENSMECRYDFLKFP